jgi:hypothetical protein
LNCPSLIPILVAASVVVCSPPFALAECSSSQPSTSAAATRHIVLRPGESRFRMLPLTNYVNTAFDTAQVSRAFSQDDYWHNHGRVIDRVAHPIDSIEDDGGWDHLVRQELLSPHVLPNLTLHLLGNGYDFRALAEWFDEHHVPFAISGVRHLVRRLSRQRRSRSQSGDRYRQHSPISISSTCSAICCSSATK